MVLATFSDRRPVSTIGFGHLRDWFERISELTVEIQREVWSQIVGGLEFCAKELGLILSQRRVWGVLSGELV